jgi:hypothetical protein
VSQHIPNLPINNPTNPQPSLKSSFLSDPDFPRSAFGYYKGMRIRFFESLYESYSRLAFTHITDRSVAMAGLEKRLARTYETRAEFGLLEKFFHRSLLWQRGGDAPMRRIRYPEGRSVPSWSWMAVEGPITYLDVPFDGAFWNEAIQSPFRRAFGPVGDRGSQGKEVVAPMRDFAVQVQSENDEFVLDQPGGTEPRGLKCVVVATEKVEAETDLQKYYVLLVAPTHASEDCRVFERAGVAVLRKGHVSLNGEGMMAHIQ